MAIFKCKMCGGTINIEEGQKVVTCDFCGTTQTLHGFDNEKKTTLFKRADSLRFKCEFDKASAIYETIVSEFPNEAEAYWGLILCKYGIEYVDDPKTGNKIPTCHRTQFSSIFDDSDYKNVIKHSDVIQRDIYQKEANEISKLQKSILDISSKEDPFDIFICYKESDAFGNRTPDSVLAQDIFKELTNEGYRVFFSRITLEDKLGSQYEPYIFAALHSAKIMLHVTTKDEYSEAVWVRNEWSRFLGLIESGQKKTLIPCYKGMSPYDLPDEMQNLQGQDMSKLGAMQDLVHGIDKIIGKNKVIQRTVVGGYTPLGAEQDAFESQVRKGYVYLNKRMYRDAQETFENAVKLIEKCGRAYIGLMLAEAEEPNIDSYLKRKGYQYDNIDKLELARSFADQKCLDELDEIDKKIEVIEHEECKDHFENLLNNYKWDEAKDYLSKDKENRDEFIEYYKAAYYKYCCNCLEMFKSIDSLDRFEKIEKGFKELDDFKDSKEKLSLCYKKKSDILEKYNNECISKLVIEYPSEKTIKDIDNVSRKIENCIRIFYSIKPCTDEIKKAFEEIIDSSTKYIESSSFDVISSLSSLKECDKLKQILSDLSRHVKMSQLKKVSDAIASQETYILDVEKRIKRKRRILRLKIYGVLIAVAIVVVAVFLGINAIKVGNEKKERYSNAESYMEKGYYSSAINLYESLGDYEKAQQKIAICNALNKIEDSISKDSEDDLIDAIKTIVKNGEKVEVTYQVEEFNTVQLLSSSTNENSTDKTEIIDSINFNLYEPTKNGYYFVRWSPLEYKYVDGKASVTLISNWSLIEYSITYKLDGGTNNTSNANKYYVNSNNVILYNPTKTGYTFKGWYDQDNIKTTLIPSGSYKSYTFTAKWEINHYAVVFKNFNGDILYETVCDYGQDVEYKGETPLRIADSQYSYVFSQWDGSLKNIKENKVFTALFDVSTNSYQVIFKNYDGTVLDVQSVKYGNKASYGGKTPVKANSDDDLLSYSFNGWDVDLSEITNNTVAVAQFKTINRYMATFNNHDGTELYSYRLNSGEVPVYSGNEPTKTPDDQYNYSFSGWSPKLTKITNDTTYIAQFDSHLNEYTVKFYNYDGKTLLQTKKVEYGKYASYTGSTPEKKSTQQYYYTFDGWDKDISTTKILEDTVFIAKFSSDLNSYTVSFYNYDGTKLDDCTVKYGSDAFYSGDTPVKPADYCGYQFDNSWLTSNNGSLIDDLSNVIDDRSVYAKYLSISFKKIASDDQYMGGFTAAITDDGRLFMWGTNTYGQCAAPVEETKVNGREVVVENETFVDVSLGYQYTLAVTSSGKVYAWGRATNYCLGDNRYQENYKDYRYTPEQILNTDGIVFKKVLAHRSCAFAIAEDGTLYSWGGNQDLALLESSYDHYPTIVAKTKLKFIDIDKANDNIIAISTDGDVYGWGYNTDYTGYVLGNVLIPYAYSVQRISDGTTKFKQLSCGPRTIAAVSTDGVLYMGGCDDNYLMLHSNGNSFSATSYTNVEYVYISEQYGLMSLKNGKVLSWGTNRFGELGASVSDVHYTRTPIEISVDGVDISNPLLISCGRLNSYLVTKDKKIITWGCQDNYLLFDNKSSAFAVSTPAVVMFPEEY